MTRKFLLFMIMFNLIMSVMLIGFIDDTWAGIEQKGRSVASGIMRTISSVDELKQLLDSKTDRLMMFDLYADWCLPCKILSSLLEEIASEQKSVVDIYKINVDKNPDIAGAFGVSGIPYVALILNKEVVYAFTGLQPKANYIRRIREFTTALEESQADLPNGELVDGIREIRLTTATSPDNIYVYRGDTVRLFIEKVDFPYSVHIPNFNISEQGTVGKTLIVTFEAKEIGVFPIFCNGQCPTGDGARYGQIVVLQYKAEAGVMFKDLSVEQALELIEQKKPLLLDVRMPFEYYQGHLEGTKLIPLSQLEGRIWELEHYRDKHILLYCRSGNRSTVAAQILTKNGFTKLYNLRFGIIDWTRKGQPIAQ